MRKKGLIIGVAAIVVVLGIAAIGAYAYDSSNNDTVAQGVTVSGVDIGGLSSAEARKKLEIQLLQPLDKPVVAAYGKEDFTLTPARAKVTADINGMVNEALSQSRQGDFLTRAWRDLSGGTETTDIPASFSYSKSAVNNFVRTVEDKVQRKPQDASVDFTGNSVAPVQSKDGLAVKAKVLKRTIKRRLLSPTGSRTVKVRVREVKPKVTTANLANEYPVVLTVDRDAKKLTLFKDLKPAKTYPIAVGQIGLETPAGLYHIQDKTVDPTWNVPNEDWAGDLAGKSIPAGPDNPIKARWLGIFNGAGIHGTADEGSLGSAASHGCVRMSVADVINLYPQVPVGAPIYIA